MKEPKLQFNREELKLIRIQLSENYFEHQLMKAEIGLIRAKEENATEKEIVSWKKHKHSLKSVIKTNKNVIKKINNFFGFDNA